MNLQYTSMRPHNSRLLNIEYQKEEDPQPIINAMSKIGWEIKTSIPHNGDRYPGKISLSKKGSGNFDGWNRSEKKSFLKEAEKTLKSFGFKSIPYLKLTLQDLL